jgi:tetratricopeptide (TPR) repeat protein
VAALALLLSGSRGAWLGLLVGSVCGIWWSQRRRFRQRPLVMQTGDVLAALLLASVFVLFLLTLLIPTFGSPLGSGTVGGTTASRASLWQDGLALVDDYRFTGSGFASTTLVLSTYVYLLHVGFLTHVHNLYLELALEQGLPGLIALLFMLGSAGWSLAEALRTRSVARVLAGGAAVALVAMAVHGLVDAGLYVSRLAPLIFLPVGFAWAMAPQRRRSRHFDWDRFSRGLAAALAPLAAVMLVFVWPGARAAFHANLGAVSQTAAELSLYAWPEWPIQDALRRSPAVDLAPAVERYALALALDPNNVTAQRRLGQIALSRGDYEAARTHLEEAYGRAPDQRATRLLLGEVYALTGRVEEAAALWRGVDLQQGQLDSRAWWIGQVGTPQQIEWFQQARQQVQVGAPQAAQR